MSSQNTETTDAAENSGHRSYDSQISVTGSQLTAEETAALAAVVNSLLADQAQVAADYYEHRTLSRQSKRRRMSTWANQELQTWRSAARMD